MSKHAHIQNLAEQIAQKGHGNAPFHNEKIFHQTSESPQAEDIHTKVVVEDFSIRLLAYQIHKKKGGTDLDNWYEAERVLSDNY